MSLTTPPLYYRVIFSCLAPLLALYTAWQGRASGDRRFLYQRLGFKLPQRADRPLWVHCASVGEVRAALPLLRALRSDARFPALLVSTATPTGAATLQAQQWDDVEHCYFPLDFSGAVGRALRAFNPTAVIVLETEIWPRLYHRCASNGTPLVIVNARVSRRTLDAPRWLLAVYSRALKAPTVLAKSALDASHYRSLGAPDARVREIGNLKFAAIAANRPGPAPLPRRFWLAASTHQDEELQLCRALLKQSALADTLLVIAPRHPARRAKIESQLSALGLRYAVRSRDETVLAETQIYLADTLGEMEQWFAHAELVFMGGSLVPVGGHNLLEPAAAAKVVISGPQLHNFGEEAELLQTVDALRVAADADAVIDEVLELLENPAQRQRLGTAGQAAVRGGQAVLQRYVDALAETLASQTDNK